MDAEQNQPIKSSEIRARLEANAQRLAELREELRPHALKAVTGDKAAAKEVARIAAEEGTLRGEVTTFEVALEQAVQLEAEAANRASEEEKQRRIREARRISGEIVADAKRFDALAAEMFEILTRRRASAHHLSALNLGRAPGKEIVNQNLINNLHRRYPLTSALSNAGLGPFLDLVNVTGRIPLAEHDMHLCGFGVPAAPAVPKRLPEAEAETLERAGL